MKMSRQFIKKGWRKNHIVRLEKNGIVYQGENWFLKKAMKQAFDLIALTVEHDKVKTPPEMKKKARMIRLMCMGIF